MIRPFAIANARSLLFLLPLFFLSCASSARQNPSPVSPGNATSPATAAVVGHPEHVLADSAGIPTEEMFIDRTLAFGVPRSDMEVQILENEGFTVGYSAATRTPLWVGYRLFADPPFTPGKRRSRFLIDKRVSNPVSHDDYSNTGYDRGHMAPNAPIARCYGEDAQRETFLTTNIIPQLPGLNQRGWEALESLISTEWAERFSEVWVFTGPIFEGPCMELESDVAVPSACYMIIVDIDDITGEVNALGVIMEQRRIEEEPLENFVFTIDEIEARTHIDFLPELEDSVESLVEAEDADMRWEVAQRLHPQFGGTPRELRVRACD